MNLSIVDDAMPVAGRENEDTWLLRHDDQQTLMMVADGATTRVVPTAMMDLIQATYSPATTAAGFAARATRDVIAQQTDHTPAEMMIAANDALRAHLLAAYGDLSPEAIARKEPEMVDYIHEDPRLLRLVLPVCVATIAKIDHASNTLHYAHAGDTALFIFQRNGRVTWATQANDDSRVLKMVKQTQEDAGASHIADILTDARVIEANRRSALSHNYVDLDGKTNRERGGGVINGLPELADYMVTGTIALDDAHGVFVCSDGMFYPAPLGESGDERDQRLQMMRDVIVRDGLGAYTNKLRAEEAADATRDRYPRFKVHDDATGIYVEL
jgi:serine/threonine protein phosphatase PrpC